MKVTDALDGLGLADLSFEVGGKCLFLYVRSTPASSYCIISMSIS